MPILSGEQPNIFGLLACGSITAAGVSPIPANGGSRNYGCTTAGFTRTGLGTYVLNLSDAITQADGHLVIQFIGGANANPTYRISNWTALGVITILTFTTGGGAADADFSFAVIRLTHQP